jgi:hypothetical protein
MDWLAPASLSAGLAGLLTYADLDRVFNPPLTMPLWQRCKLAVLWWGFVLANGLLAGFLFFTLKDVLKNNQEFKIENEWLRAFAIGAAYSAIIRLKVTTLSINGQSVPAGPELIYEGFKDIIHRRINRIISWSRAEEAGKLTGSDTLTLRNRARTLAMSDSLMSDEVRNKTVAWIEDIATGEGITDPDRRIHLATYIVTGQLRPRP